LVAACGIGACAAIAAASPTNNILITGYWPPTNEMLRPWSMNATQNPTGWIGQDWEGRGFDIHAFFPEFPNGTSGTNGRGVGDLEVDYQDTATDWATITAQIKPVAIITFSRANTPRGWELEPAYRRFRVSGEANPAGRSISFYTSDYLAPLQPSNVPIISEPIGNVRPSALPMQDIVSAVAAQMTLAQVDPFIPALGPAYDYGGAFLSGYIGYLGVWYHDQNNTPAAPYRCYAAGHVHVGLGTLVPDARQATEITLRTLITYLNTVVTFCPADANRDGNATVQDTFDFLTRWFAGDPRANVNADGLITVQDIFDFLTAWFTGCA
jgi:hypothetical protein